MNTELYLIRGLPNLFATVGIESLIGGGSWFTQSLRTKAWKSNAFGQVEHNHQRSRINWLLSTEESDSSTLHSLIDNLAFEAGLHGAKFMLASTAVNTPLFETLRRAGYCVYGWEKFWKVNPTIPAVPADFNNHWQRPSAIDIHELIKFQHKQLSPAARAVTPLANEILPDYIWVEGDSIKAYAFIKSFGNKGIIFPVFASTIEKPLPVLTGILSAQQEYINIWYISQITSHDWLDPVLEQIAQPVTPRLELLVKYFAIMEKLPVGVLNHAAESRHPDPIAPFMNTSKR